MPKMNVSESIIINSPKEKIYDIISDFNQWQVWSPWLIMEEGVKVNVAEDAKYYDWEGNRVGSGNMKILNEDKNKSVDYDLNFIKPWKSHAKVKFVLEEEGNATKVTWTMDSSLPFFMFWMKKMMTKLVSMDYERGLLMLKDYVEDGKVHSSLDFKGVSDFSGYQYIGVKTTCTKAEVGTQMMKDFEKLASAVDGAEDKVAGELFSIYHKFDVVNDKIAYTSGIPVKEVPETLPDGVITGEMPDMKVYRIGHTGPYEHLGNAWSTAQSLMRSKEVKKSKATHPFEIYYNDPSEVDAKELKTDICFAVK